MQPVKSEGRILALDYGEKRIGLALSDPLRILAKPLKIIENKGLDYILSKIEAVVNEYEVKLVLVGMPYAIEGGDTSKTIETRKFMAKLADNLSIPIQSWDERYSTDEAIKELIKMGYDWKERRKIQDAMAAAMILKSYLENQ
ncbi:MAG: Holliday junction resolvase RuvX [Candidatus Cloacimonetes bacterium]|nr:Holliday junction resolvase RuvX [Candidatus Cloacimonadota bacterium]MCB5257868.1 Holliday junction resolvase RuvX [Candidatus Cloacimonadota bacterium]